MSRRLAFIFSMLPIAAATSVLLLAPLGCGPIGCFPASEAGGTCPAQDDALPYFGDPECGGQVASVDSEASIRNGAEEEGNLCCYAISNKDREFTACPDF